MTALGRGRGPWLLAATGLALFAAAVASAGCGDEETGGSTTTTSAGGCCTTGPTSSTTTSGNTSTTSTSGGTGGQGGSALGWYGELPTLNNDPVCAEWGSVTPDPGEAGHLHAVRLTPPSYPFVVTEVQYELWGEGECDNSFAHRVEVFVDSATSPPATPAAPVIIDVAAIGANEIPIRVVREALPSPLTLQQDEQLFVAVELPTETTSCVAVCSPATDDDRDYWSGATAAPYAWQPITSFGIDATARIGVNGAPE